MEAAGAARPRLLRARRQQRLLRRSNCDRTPVDVTADLERVHVRLDSRVVADHARSWARRATVTDPNHVEVARQLRQQLLMGPVAVNDLHRDLADYDRAFGLDGQVA